MASMFNGVFGLYFSYNVLHKINFRVNYEQRSHVIPHKEQGMTASRVLSSPLHQPQRNSPELSCKFVHPDLKSPVAYRILISKQQKLLSLTVQHLLVATEENHGQPAFRTRGLQDSRSRNFNHSAVMLVLFTKKIIEIMEESASSVTHLRP